MVLVEILVNSPNDQNEPELSLHLRKFASSVAATCLSNTVRWSAGQRLCCDWTTSDPVGTRGCERPIDSTEALDLN